MKTRFRSALLLVPLAFTAGFVALSWTDCPARPKPPDTRRVGVSVARFAQPLPVGYLGVPLGTVVRVTGMAIDGTTLLWKTYDGKTMLHIETVNGKRLARPVDFEFFRADNEVRKPAFGERFDYYVHEYGHFDGVVTPPKELGIPTVLVANDGFHYRPYVTVHASKPIQK